MTPGRDAAAGRFAPAPAPTISIYGDHEKRFDDEPAKLFASGGVVKRSCARAGQVRYLGFTGQDPALPGDARPTSRGTRVNCHSIASTVRSGFGQVLPELNRRDCADRDEEPRRVPGSEARVVSPRRVELS